MFLDLDAIPTGWHFSKEDISFYLDCEECFVAGELSEKNMNAEDKAKFAEAKRAELQSFFDNQVWEQDRSEVTDPDKVLRARFLLKWSRNADGSYRAKARLVIQGFRDPDAIAGKLAKSSPTMTRLSRTFIVLFSRIHGWLHC